MVHTLHVEGSGDGAQEVLKVGIRRTIALFPHYCQRTVLYQSGQIDDGGTSLVKIVKSVQLFMM